MAEITLSDYIGFIFSEITRARETADRVSTEIAKVYSKDEILKYFSVPRFKIPEMEISVPVLISGVKFSTALVFNMGFEKFRDLLKGKVQNILLALQIRKFNIDTNIIRFKKEDIFIKPIVFRAPESSRNEAPLKADDFDAVALDFYEALKANADPAIPDNIIKVKWGAIFSKLLSDNKLEELYKERYAKNELYLQSVRELIDLVKQNTIITSTKVQNLLVDPETYAVKEGTTDFSVFTVKAKIMEDGFFVRTIKDDNSQQEKQVVEFD